MERSQRRPLGLSYLAILLLAFNIILPTQALYFYIDGAAGGKCFYEELPKDTLVVGEHCLPKNPQIKLSTSTTSLAPGIYILTPPPRPLHRLPTGSPNPSLHYQPRPQHPSNR